ncbi:MAG: acylating sulfoacetaldehyde dehydrogenase [Gammaproteobacteria bacterium]
MSISTASATPETSTPEDQAAHLVSDLMTKARAAQAVYARFDQARVDEVVTAVAWSLLEPATNLRLSEQAVADTGLGRVRDKFNKNHRKTLGLLRDLKGKRTVGVVAEYPDQGLVEIARPVGVVGAIVPSTNPVATPYNKTLNALKAGNAIILAPSPKGQQVAEEVVSLIRAALRQVGAPEDLVQKLPSPVNKAATHELMKQVDLVVVTGSQNNVRAAYTSGTPAIGVGAGNVASIVDESADLADAADKITASKTFDNATSCSSENSVVLCEAIHDAMIDELVKRGARRLNTEEKERLRETMWPDGRLSGAVTAKSANEILDAAGIDRAGRDISIILVDENHIDAGNKFCNEKLSPVLTVFKAADFQAAKAIVAQLYAINGAGHSVSLHTSSDERELELGLELPVCRVIVNQAHCFATGGAFNNGLPFSLSMGCGTWGGNIISDNMNVEHYLNTTRISREIPVNEPSLEEIFGDYWRKYAMNPEG